MNAQCNILVLHGPNLNLLGMREPQHYGKATLDSINQSLQAKAQAHHITCSCFQSNSESALIERIHQAYADNVRFIIINPAAFTHTSIAIRDALTAVAIPFIEIHLSNVQAREPFRHHSYFSDLAVGIITGLGAQGYELALSYVLNYLSQAADSAS